MARDKLYDKRIDVTEGGHSIIISLVQGEQLELPCVVDIWDVADPTYGFEALVIEGNNQDTQGQVPTTHNPGATPKVLNVRVPLYRGNWNAGTAYNTNDVIKSGSTYYRLFRGTNYVNSTSPSGDPTWIVHDPRTIYIQFPYTLSRSSPAWATPPTADKNVYGFFELAITEPGYTAFNRIWKPIRGLVEILFSPTELQ